MIIIGYPGIGKTTYCRNRSNAVDLESSLFDRLDFNTDKAWARTYSTVAKDISDQGFLVFISSHKKVVEEVKNECNPMKYLVIIPDISLKTMWTERLSSRYEKSEDGLIKEKNKRAYERCLNHFDTDISWLEQNVSLDNVFTIQEKWLNKNPVDLIDAALTTFLWDGWVNVE